MRNANYINHITLLLDASSSMQRHRHDLVKVADAQIGMLAERSKFHDQETRITVYSFTHDGMGNDFKCLVYDKDVLRMPSIAGLYHPNGWTPLADAVTFVIGDLKLIPEKYGDHSHLLYVLTDGYECLPGATSTQTHTNRRNLPTLLGGLPVNWTIAAFAPDAVSKHELVNFGFPRDNIKIWDPNESIQEVGVAMAASTDYYMGTVRSSGARSTKNLLSMNAPDLSEIKQTMPTMTHGSYYFEQVTEDDLGKVTNGRIDEFMQLKTGKPYSPDGRTYYQMTQRVRIQPNKKIAIADKQGNVYTGAEARVKLGLYPEGTGAEVRVSPGRWKDYDVFVQSTSFNRRLYPGTRVLVMR